MSMYKELSYDKDISGIKGIQFCILSAEGILSRSVAEINRSETYNGNDPVPHGIFDPRMGVIEHNKVCVTCEKKNTFCPGHFGHIVLSKPVFYIQFFNITRNLLKCVCYRCSKLLVDAESEEIKALMAKKGSRQKRYEIICKMSAKIKRCGQLTVDGCGAKQPSITKDGMLKLAMEWKEMFTEADVKRQVLNAEDVLRIFRRISDRDSEILGFNKKFNRPEDLICTVLPVPPPAVRPSVRNDTGQRSEDDLTHKLSMIVKVNNQLKQRVEKGIKEHIDLFSMLLQYEIATLIDNTIPGINPSLQRTGRPIRSLIERLKGKEGRIRGNLMGKRVDFSARSVITPDPNISIDELGVPIKIAMNLTFPEVVNKYNVAELRVYVDNGPDIYPGAKHVRKASDGRTIRLRNMDRSSIELEYGDIVARHIRNGDYVLFNRQPSLHRSSMMAHRVRVMQFNTFRLNVMVTPSFNADFDGDEMNMHVAQSYQTHEELRLAAVPTQIISPREYSPIVSVVQDIVAGLYRLTKQHVKINAKQMSNIMAANPRCSGELVPAKHVSGQDHKWTGHQLLSTIMPRKITVNMGNSHYDSEKKNEEHYVKIKCGEVIQGVFDKGIYQARTAGIVHSIYNEYGPEETRVFFDNTQQLICNWLVLDGFSVGISDMVVDSAQMEKFKSVISEMKASVYKVIEDVHSGRYENNSTKTNFEDFEKKVNDITNNVIKEVGDAGVKVIDENVNRLINMIKSKSKGSSVNVSQMIGCLGQQNVDGRRIPNGFDDRSLPHFSKYDDGPEAHGFVESSFIKGLTPQEFFFAAMGGREGLIDTAVQSVTWETPIMIIEGGRPKRVLIGEWIDAHLDNEDNKGSIRHFDEKSMELLDIKDKVYIPTANEDGKMSWGELTAVTRHDPGERLYKVTTQGGRMITVAESKSLLVWNKDTKKFVETDSTKLKIGDKMPVAMYIPEPPIIVDHIDMSEYLSKTDYIYGTEFHRAIKLMKEAQGDKFAIPKGWWEDNNGKTFITPYTKKASLQRVIGRSNVDNIREGCVYPYHATRCHGHMPDKFELNKENGIFIGLFLADGCTNEPSGSIGITKNDKSVQDWVAGWFTKHGFSSKLFVKVVEDSKDGTRTVDKSCTMIGYSQLLCRFLNAFVDKGSQCKYVPDVAFTAPIEFVVGLLSGYFSGDGYLTNGGIACHSTSRRLIEGISLLCNRIGVFGKLKTIQPKSNNILPMHHLIVRGQWGSKLNDNIEWIHDRKKAKASALKFALKNMHFDDQEDVVLDGITNIQVIGVENHPKLYDVSVPSTLNFMVHSGLISFDTSETGYLQRKLVKSMEDCKVGYDGSVRNASGAIVQFLYGDDGMDACKIESQRIPYMEMHQDQIATEYQWDAATSSALSKRLDDHYNRILADRVFLITKVFRGQAENSIAYPVSLFRTINIARGLNVGGTELKPDYVLDALDLLEQELYVNKHHRGTQLFHMLVRAYLSPKVSIIKNRLSRETFDYICEQIRVKFHQSLASPLEMVGVLAAQSLGEPSTQLSVVSTALVIIETTSVDGKRNMYYGPIGQLIDKVLDGNKSNVVDLGGNSSVLDMKEGMTEMRIIGVSNQEKTSWRRISQVSRHPANGGMVRIYTLSGKTTCATLSHSFLKRTTRGISPVLGSDLKVGDRVPVAKWIPEVSDPINTVFIGKDIALDKDFGWLCGTYIADGYVIDDMVGISISKVIPEYQDKLCQIYKDLWGLEMSQCENRVSFSGLAKFMLETFNTGSFNKRVPGWVYAANIEFVKGLICGYFDGNGNVNDVKGKQMIRSASVSSDLTQDIVVLLTRVGIFASKCVETYKKEPNQNGLHTIQISRKYAHKFRETVGPMVVKHKDAALLGISEYVEREDKHDNSEYIDKIPELGDILAAVGKALKLPGQSRLYKRFQKKESIGRETLGSYMPIFERALEEETVKAEARYKSFNAKLIRMKDILATARATLGVINKVGIMDLDAESGADMLEIRTPTLGCNALGAANLRTVVKAGRINVDCFEKNILALVKGTKDMRMADIKRLDEVRYDLLPALRQALEADVVWDEIVKLEHLPDPGEMVYDFTVPGNDSFMVDCGVLVHNTLNSVHHDTDLLLRIDGQLSRTTIGDFSERHINAAPEERLEHHPNDTTLAWLKDGKEEGLHSKVEVLAPTKDGKIIWDEVCAVTKHPVKNEDGSNTLLHVKTCGGREVIATKGDSFVMRIDNTIQAVKGSDLKVGDLLPVSNILPVGNELMHLDVSMYLPKTEFIYKEGIVYPQKCDLVSSMIPDKIPLTASFGFIVGAYLAEGCVSQCNDHVEKMDQFHQLLISNMDPDFRAEVDAFSKAMCVQCHLDEHIRSTTQRIHSVVLATLFARMLGYPAPNKRFPSHLLAANDDFLKGVVGGYFSGGGGDGSVEKNERGEHVNIVSVSRGLLEDIRLILAKFDIRGAIKKKDEQIEPTYTLEMYNNNAFKFIKMLKQKQEKMAIGITHEFTYDKHDFIPSIKLSDKTIDKIHRDKIADLMETLDKKEDKLILSKVLSEDLFYDRIVSIKEVPNTESHVYDLTTKETRMFSTFGGLAVFDTFHFSGVSSASKSVRGVPRLKELLSVSKNLKTPSMRITFKEEMKNDKAKCEALMHNIRVVRFKDIVVKSQIFFDPNDSYNDDSEFIKLYRDFLSNDEDKENNKAALKTAPWLIRFEFDKEAMMRFHLDMIQIHNKLLDFYKEDVIACRFNDDNATNLIFRIKLIAIATSDDDMFTEIKALEHNIMEKIMIKGTEGIENVGMDKDDTFKYDPVTSTFVKMPEFTVYTDGSNFKELLTNDQIDAARLYTNNVNEILETLGIEAARQAQFNEIMAVMEGVTVNYRHVALLVDMQTNKGNILSVDRHGINRGDIGPLAKCSFEESTDKLIKAGIFAEYDKINGVSANIMLGAIVPAGTGDVTIIMDEDMLQETTDQPYEELSALDDELCREETFEFDFVVPEF